MSAAAPGSRAATIVTAQTAITNATQTCAIPVTNAKTLTAVTHAATGAGLNATTNVSATMTAHRAAITAALIVMPTTTGATMSATNATITADATHAITNAARAVITMMR